MGSDLHEAQRRVNWSRFRPGSSEGFYESFFQRANHPSRPLAFWIRYTLFSPRGRPEDTIGERWAIFFDGETNRHVAVKDELPFERCSFAQEAFDVSIGDAHLDGAGLTGAASSRGHQVAWDLTFTGTAPPLFDFPIAYYERPLPRAKPLVSVPDAVYRGTITVDDRAVAIDGWRGTQNHNWGTRHTDHYAWGQVAGFDDDPDAFLEVATARLRLGPLWTPWLTPLTLRHRGEEIAFNTPLRSLVSSGSFRFFDWTFRAARRDVVIEGHIFAPSSAFVGLTYQNPPGGTKTCLNSKLATCELTITRRGRAGAQVDTLRTASRAAFEILVGDPAPVHGIEMRA